MDDLQGRGAEKLRAAVQILACRGGPLSSRLADAYLFGVRQIADTELPPNLLREFQTVKDEMSAVFHFEREKLELTRQRTEDAARRLVVLYEHVLRQMPVSVASR